MNDRKKAHESQIVWQEISARQQRLGQIAIERHELDVEEERIKSVLANLTSGLSLMEATSS